MGWKLPLKSGKQIERCVISTFQIAEGLGFKGEQHSQAYTLPDRDESGGNTRR